MLDPVKTPEMLNMSINRILLACMFLSMLESWGASVTMAAENDMYHFVEPTAAMLEHGDDALFKGRMVLQGRFEYVKDPQGCGEVTLNFVPDTRSSATLPEPRDLPIYTLSFNNDGKTLAMLNAQSLVSRADGEEFCAVVIPASVEIGDITSNGDCVRTSRTDLLRVFATGKPSFQRCYEQTCTVKDPTGSDLNVRDLMLAERPVTAQITNGTRVQLMETMKEDKGEVQWVYVRWKKGKDWAYGSVFRPYLDQCAP